MVYSYNPPRTDTFNFVVFTLIVTALSLTLVKNREFRASKGHQNLLTVSLACVIFVFPSIIYLRLALSEHAEGPYKWRKTRNLLFIEAGAQGLGLIILTLLWFLKYKRGPRCFRRLNPANLHWYLNRNSFDKAVEKHGKSVVCRKHNTDWEPTSFFDDNNNILFWRLNMVFFWYHYVFIGVFVLFSLAINFYISYNLYNLQMVPTVTSFADSMFFIVFGITLIALFLWFLCKKCIWTAVWNFGIILHVIVICYFICDTPVLASLLLGSLIIFLSNLYDMVNDPSIAKVYDVPGLLCLQHKARDPAKMPDPVGEILTNYMDYAKPSLTESQKREIVKEVLQEIRVIMRTSPTQLERPKKAENSVTAGTTEHVDEAGHAEKAGHPQEAEKADDKVIQRIEKRIEELSDFNLDGINVGVLAAPFAAMHRGDGNSV